MAPGSAAVAALAAAVGLLTPDADYLDRRAIPWVVGAVDLLVAGRVLNPPTAAGGQELATGAWLAFGGAIAMAVGAISASAACRSRSRSRGATGASASPPSITGPRQPRPAGPWRAEQIARHPDTEGSEGLMPLVHEVGLQTGALSGPRTTGWRSSAVDRRPRAE